MAARFAQGDLQGRSQPHAKTPGRPRKNLRSKRMPACGKRAEPDLYKRQTRIPKHSPVFGKGRQRRPREKAHPAIKARLLPHLGREFATCFRDYGIRGPLSTKRVPPLGVSNAPLHFWINPFDPVSPGGGVLGVCASKRLYGDFGGLIGDYGHLLFVCAVRIEVKHES